MPHFVSKTQFKAKALEYFRLVEKVGGPVIVTDHGEPKLEVRRFRPEAADPLARLRGSVLAFERPMDPVGDGDWGRRR